VIGADQDRQIAGHIPALDSVDANAFEVLGKSDDIGSVVERAAIAHPTRPGEIEAIGYHCQTAGFPCDEICRGILVAIGMTAD